MSSLILIGKSSVSVGVIQDTKKETLKSGKVINRKQNFYYLKSLNTYNVFYKDVLFPLYDKEIYTMSSIGNPFIVSKKSMNIILNTLVEGYEKIKQGFDKIKGSESNLLQVKDIPCIKWNNKTNEVNLSFDLFNKSRLKNDNVLDILQNGYSDDVNCLLFFNKKIITKMIDCIKYLDDICYTTFRIPVLKKSAIGDLVIKKLNLYKKTKKVGENLYEIKDFIYLEDINENKTILDSSGKNEIPLKKSLINYFSTTKKGRDKYKNYPKILRYVNRIITLDMLKKYLYKNIINYIKRKTKQEKNLNLPLEDLESKLDEILPINLSKNLVYNFNSSKLTKEQADIIINFQSIINLYLDIYLYSGKVLLYDLKMSMKIKKVEIPKPLKQKGETKAEIIREEKDKMKRKQIRNVFYSKEDKKTLTDVEKVIKNIKKLTKKNEELEATLKFESELLQKYPGDIEIESAVMLLENDIDINKKLLEVEKQKKEVLEKNVLKVPKTNISFEELDFEIKTLQKQLKVENLTNEEIQQIKLQIDKLKQRKENM